jgi:hypothetical protein
MERHKLMALRKLIAGNWKMNGSQAALAELDGTLMWTLRYARQQPLSPQQLRVQKGSPLVGRIVIGMKAVRTLAVFRSRCSQKLARRW